MPSTSYLWEKSMVAVGCLAGGAGSFEQRLQDAYISSLMRLRSEDVPRDLADDLKWILDLCESHHSATGFSPISESDRRKAAEKLIHILIETSRTRA